MQRRLGMGAAEGQEGHLTQPGEVRGLLMAGDTGLGSEEG